MCSDVQWRTRERARWGAKWASIFGEWWFGASVQRKSAWRQTFHNFWSVPALSSDFKPLLHDIVSSHLGRRRPHSMRRVYKNLCPATISASIMVANMWKNSLKNVESNNNKILYETLLDLFVQRNGTYFLNKPRINWHRLNRSNCMLCVFFTERCILDAGASYNKRCCCNIELTELQGKILHFLFVRFGNWKYLYLGEKRLQGLIIKNMLKYTN